MVSVSSVKEVLCLFILLLASERILVQLSRRVRKTLGRHKKRTKDESAKIKLEGTVSN